MSSNNNSFPVDRRTLGNPYDQPGHTMDCYDQAMSGILMGLVAGAGMGAFGGLFMARSLRNNGLPWFKTFVKITAGSSASFGVFLGVGSFVRCDEIDSTIFLPHHTTSCSLPQKVSPSSSSSSTN